MIKIKIYDYENNAKEIELRDDLKLLVVRVISGDEVILAYYKDSTAESFDSCDCRTDDHDDGIYIVDTDKLDAWFNFDVDDDKFKGDYFERDVISYARQAAFCNEQTQRQTN